MSFLSNLESSIVEISVLSFSKQKGRSPVSSILFKSETVSPRQVQFKKCWSAWSAVVLHQNPVISKSNTSFKFFDSGVFLKTTLSNSDVWTSDLVRQWSQLSLVISNADEHSWFWKWWSSKGGHMENSLLKQKWFSWQKFGWGFKGLQ